MKKGMVSIMRFCGTTAIGIEIYDNKTDRLVRVKMSPHEFALALTGSQWRECEYEEGIK